jgi:hypothetical protein
LCDLMSSSSSSSSSSLPSSTLSSLHLSSPPPPPLSISVPSTFIFESTHNEDGEIIDNNAKIFENNKEGEEEEAYDAISRLPFTTEEEVLGQSVSQQPLTQETKLRRRGGGGGGGGGGQIEGGGEMPPALYGFGPMQPSPPPFVWVAQQHLLHHRFINPWLLMEEEEEEEEEEKEAILPFLVCTGGTALGEKIRTTLHQ